MVKLGTKCNECVFYENEAERCTLGKIDKFIEAGANVVWESDGPQIDRVCMYRRPFTWSLGKTMPECEDLVKEEVYVSGTLLLLTDSLEDLQKTLNVLSGSKNIERFKLIVSHSESLSMDEVKDVMANVYFASQLCMLSLIEEREKILYECFKKAKNGVFVVLDCSKELDPLFLDKINHLLNVEMLKVAHIKPIEGYHCSVTSAVIYKHIYGDLGASVEQKLMESEAENLITSWEVVNEKYPN